MGMNKDTLVMKIEDYFGLHRGFELRLNKGFTALVGPNGAGKTVLLSQIKAFADKNKIKVWEYSNIKDGGHFAMQRYMYHGDGSYLATALTSSEGEQVALNFSKEVYNLGGVVADARKADIPVVVLIDGVDSGASIDRVKELRDLFKMIQDTEIMNGAKLYLIMAVNQYELVKDGIDCVNVRTGEHLGFKAYDEYSEFICSYNDRYLRLE